MGKLILIRHGESEANRLRCYAESGDVPLTALGRQQALDLVPRIARQFQPQRAISSEFLRARQTAAIIAHELAVPLETVRGIHERDFGCLKGHPYDSLRAMTAQDPAYDPERDWLWAPAGGESRDDVRRRVMAALEEVRRRYPEEEVLVVCHGVVMVSVWAHLTGTWTGANVPANCGMVLVEHDAAGFGPPLLAGELEPLPPSAPAPGISA